MRDLIVFLLFVGVLPLCFLRPWVGLCTFTWLAYNRTQDLTWGFARTLPISQFVAIFFLLGWLVFDFRKPALRGPIPKAMVALLVWIGVSMVLTDMNWALQKKHFTELSKVILVSVLTATMLVDRTRLRVIMAIIAVGLGFFGFKNGLLLFMGSRSIIGPGGMMSDNNDFALALAMNMPLLWYLADEMKPLKYGFYIHKFMRAAFWLNFFAIMSTGSRGGFLSMGVGAMLMAWKTKWKVPALAAMVLGGVLFIGFGPQEYRDRLSTIFVSDMSELDESAAGRIKSWLVAINMVEASPVFGIGINKMKKEYNNYTEGIPNAEGGTDHYARVAHNSYLQLAAESGIPALLLFLFVVVGTIVVLQIYSSRYRRSGDEWIVPYCRAIQISLCVYMVGATFLNRSHFDLVYQYVMIVSTFPVIVAQERKDTVPRRTGPRIADEVRIAHRDPFVQVGSR